MDWDKQGIELSARDATAADELSLLIDSAINYAIYMLDPEGRVTIWNRGAERIKGWTEAEVIGQPSSIFYAAEDVEAGKPAEDLARAARFGRIDEEVWRVRKDGSEFLASVTITALRDADGALRGFGKVLRDITDERAADQALQRQSDHLHSILETVPDAMVVIDQACVISSFSAAAERLFGYQAQEVVGRNVSILMPEPDRGRHDDYVGQYLVNGGQRVIGTTRLVTGLRRDGTTFPMELAVGETVSGGERIFTGFVRDLSERRRSEIRIQELQSELIHVSRLSAMGTMASTLAHELNQPLAAIANYLEAARDLVGAPDADTGALLREALDEAAQQSLRAGQIVRRLRDFVARGEVGKRVESLASIVQEARTLGLVGAHERGVRATTDLDAAVDAVLVDRVQVQQVLVNLIRNALESMDGCPVRELGIRSARETANLVRLSVSDTGSGLSGEMASRLFEAFATTKRDGMGLGLSICRTIVEANGGRIWMAPRAGGGSEFHFTLMRAQTEGSGG